MGEKTVWLRDYMRESDEVMRKKDYQRRNNRGKSNTGKRQQKGKKVGKGGKERRKLVETDRGRQAG
jgi:hypothetical protein